MKTAEQYLADMSYVGSNQQKVWEETHMLTVLKHAMQAQHEATWAVAMAEAKKQVRNKLGITSRALPILNAVPCPPLNTNPTKDGE